MTLCEYHIHAVRRLDSRVRGDDGGVTVDAARMELGEPSIHFFTMQKPDYLDMRCFYLYPQTIFPNPYPVVTSITLKFLTSVYIRQRRSLLQLHQGILEISFDPRQMIYFINIFTECL